jgi:hypothetical protein
MTTRRIPPSRRVVTFPGCSGDTPLVIANQSQHVYVGDVPDGVTSDCAELHQDMLSEEVVLELRGGAK